MIAQSMAQVAIRFSEPEGAASDSMVTVGQAIRRELHINEGKTSYPNRLNA
jgi:hypothetical protein